MARFLGILAALLLFAYGSVLAASARAVVPGEVFGSSGADAFEPADERREAPAPLAPTDITDDDDDDEQEASSERSHVVPWRCPIALETTPQSETIRPSLGHPRGIDDPPRS